MKKAKPKLHLSRETLHRLETTDLSKIVAGASGLTCQKQTQCDCGPTVDACPLPP